MREQRESRIDLAINCRLLSTSGNIYTTPEGGGGGSTPYNGQDRRFRRFRQKGSEARFSKVPVTLRARNQIFKSKYKE